MVGDSRNRINRPPSFIRTPPILIDLIKMPKQNAQHPLSNFLHLFTWQGDIGACQLLHKNPHHVDATVDAVALLWSFLCTSG